MKQNSKFRVHFGWLLAGIYASIVVLVSIANGSIYHLLDFRMIDRDTEPVWYWFLFGGHILIAFAGFRIGLSWGDPQVRRAYEEQKMRDRKWAESEGTVSGRKIAITASVLVVIFLVVWLVARMS